MRLSETTYSALLEAGVDCGKLAETLGSAKAKREVTRTSLTQSNKSFTGSEGFKMARAKLTDAENLACSIEAFDTHMTKAVKLWGVEDWTIPAAMAASAKAIWPYKAVPATAVPATVPA